MKLFLFLVVLGASGAFAEESRDGPWPPKDVAFVVGYCYDYTQDERGISPVFEDGSLHRGIIRSATVQLSPEQQQRLIKVVTTEVEFEESLDCYNPNHAFVIYDAARKPVGWIGISIGCGNYRFSSHNAPDYIAYGELRKLCDELKLPMFTDSTDEGEAKFYRDFFRAELPESERDKVLSWQQYLKRENDYARDRNRKLVERLRAKGLQDPDDPFAPNGDDPSAPDNDAEQAAPSDGDKPSK